MFRSSAFEVVLLAEMALLCLGVPVANAENNLLNWTSPTTMDLYSISMVNDSDGWAVGYCGVIVRWNGTVWNNVTSPTTMNLYSASTVSTSDGWAVGLGGVIVRWNGTVWNNVTSPISCRLWSVHMVSSNDGWAVGEGGVIVRWTGVEWIPEFPLLELVLLLQSATLVMVILGQILSKKRKKLMLPCKSKKRHCDNHRVLLFS